MDDKVKNFEKWVNDMNDPQVVGSDGLPSCMKLWMKTMDCFKTTKAMDAYRKDQDFDCRPYFYDTFTCLRAKAYSDVEKRKEIIATTTWHQEAVVQPTSRPNDIFEYKETPGWG